MMRVAIVINELAGTIKAAGRSDYTAMIREHLSAMEISGEIILAKRRNIISGIQRGIDSRVDAIIIGGGDGTINTAVNIILPHRIPLGILPLGTLNHFAKDLGIPLDIGEALKTIGNGNIRKVDVGEVNGRYFINNSSIGLYPHIVHKRDHDCERLGRGKWVSMFSAALALFRRFPLMRVQLKVDEEYLTRVSPFVFVGNNDYHIDLLNLGSRAKLDQGLLSLYTTNKTGRLGLLKLAILGIFGQLNQARDFDSRMVANLTIATKRRKLKVAVDGEVISLRPPLNYRIHHQLLPVFAPLTEPLEHE